MHEMWLDQRENSGITNPLHDVLWCLFVRFQSETIWANFLGYHSHSCFVICLVNEEFIHSLSIRLALPLVLFRMEFIILIDLS